jgi:hypothetical protein
MPGFDNKHFEAPRFDELCHTSSKKLKALLGWTSPMPWSARLSRAMHGWFSRTPGEMVGYLSAKDVRSVRTLSKWYSLHVVLIL